jgi:hypothetical protein
MINHRLLKSISTHIGDLPFDPDHTVPIENWLLKNPPDGEMASTEPR